MEIQQYYTKLFTATSVVTPSFENLQFKSIDNTRKGWLERSFDEDEVVRSIKLCGDNKAPGPDGYNLEFDKACWGSLRTDVMDAINESFCKGKLDWKLNMSFLKLIPKKEDYATPKDYRPLSLIGSFYKIVSKLRAERLKVVIPSLISNAQGAFIKNKQILDGILIANECIDRRLRKKKPSILCKIDMEKAFDNVN